jgi:uncharacterized membrane protein
MKINLTIVIKSAIITVSIGLFIRAILYAVSIPSVKEAIAMATTVKPETFTELYFEDHINLPNKIEIGKAQAFKFTIHNLEYRNMTYKYEIQAIDEKGDRTLVSGSATLSQDEYRTISTSYKIATASGRMKIQVVLLDLKQLIDFWMEPI